MNRPAVVIPLALVVVALGGVGQGIIKRAINRIPGDSSLVSSALHLGRDLSFYGGLTVVAVGSFIWFIAMSKANLSYAVPLLAGLSILAVMVVSILFLREPVSASRLAGAAVIAAGIVLVSWR